MQATELGRHLAALDRADFARAPLAKSGEEVAWLPVASAVSRVSGHETPVGLLEDASWVLSQRGLRPVVAGAELPPLLCWLEYPAEEVRALLGEGLAARGLPEAGADAFPYHAVAEYGLRSTEAWALRALDWLGGPVALSPGVADALGALLRSDWIEGEARRRAAKLVAALAGGRS